MTNPLVTISKLSKSYAGVNALRSVSLEIGAGEVHGLCGENGAGKSTLIKCLSGVTIPDSGEVHFDESKLPFGNVATAADHGIAVIHQESTVFPDLTATENIFIGKEQTTRWGLMDKRSMRRETKRLLGLLGQGFPIDQPASSLSLANCQMIAMARALSQDCKLMIMDEPTASLSARETDVLLETVLRLQSQGVAVLYVSHRLNEIFELCNRVTILRDGELVATEPIDDLDENALIRFMVGRDATQSNKATSRSASGDTRLEVRNFSGALFRDISFRVREGEIVGLAGLVGAGRSELARAIMGIDSYSSGEVLVADRMLPRQNVRAAMDRGVALVPEDRQHEGLVLPMTVAENMTLCSLRSLTKRGLINHDKETNLVDDFVKRLDVRAASSEIQVSSLSGGNQQKVVIGKWLARDPSVLMLDEPTRGVDVGAKAQVHDLIRKLASDGMATLIISSELPELLSICDRILVMCEGVITGELDREHATEEKVLQLALPDRSDARPEEATHA